VTANIARRASAEAVGTAFLVAVVVGSGIAAQRLSPGNVGLELLENSTATGAGLVALILALGPVSGAHFNPIVTLADRIRGRCTTGDALAYTVAQVVGAAAGAIVANLMFGMSAITLSTHARSAGGLWLGELVATFGLLVVILGVAREPHPAVGAFAVGGYIAAAYWFTSSTSFANPAVTIGRTLTNSFAGIRPSSAPAFIVAQLAGGIAAIALARWWYAEEPAPELLLPHDRSEAP